MVGGSSSRFGARINVQGLCSQIRKWPKSRVKIALMQILLEPMNNFPNQTLTKFPTGRQDHKPWPIFKTKPAALTNNLG
jgi:hypothetical protein